LLWTDEAGHFVEACTAAIVVEVDGALLTTPHDGRVLPSVTVIQLASRARAMDLPWAWRAPRQDADWDAIYVASSGRDLAIIKTLDGRETPGWGPLGRRLADSWDPEIGELV